MSSRSLGLLAGFLVSHGRSSPASWRLMSSGSSVRNRMRPCSLTWVGRFSILRSWIEVVTSEILNDSAYGCPFRASDRSGRRVRGRRGEQGMRSMALWAAVITMLSFGVSAQDTTKLSDADMAAIKATALDYAQGWYAGDGDRLQKALHPELAKRMVYVDKATGKSRLVQMSDMTLVNPTRDGSGRPTPKADQQAEVTILDSFGNTAQVK